MEGSRRLLSQAEVVAEAAAAAAAVVEAEIQDHLDEVQVGRGHTACVGYIFDAALGRSGYAGVLARSFRIGVVQREGWAPAHLGNPSVQQSPQLALGLAALGHNLVEGTAVVGMVAAWGTVASAHHRELGMDGEVCEAGTFPGEEYA